MVGTSDQPAQAAVTLDTRTRTITVRDNGVGMDWITLNERFLCLGGTDKAADGLAIGGFGVAKAIILGVSETGDWSVRAAHQMGLIVCGWPGSTVEDSLLGVALGFDHLCTDIPGETLRFIEKHRAWLPNAGRR